MILSTIPSKTVTSVITDSFDIFSFSIDIIRKVKKQLMEKFLALEIIIDLCEKTHHVKQH